MFARLVSKLVLAATTVALTTLGTAAVQERAAHARTLTCDQIQLAATIFNSQIVDKLDACAAGEEFVISDRKKVVLDGVSVIRAAGCEITVVVDVTLKRKLLRDVHGTVTARARVTADTLDDNRLKLAFDNIRLADVDLEHIGALREWLFERVANRVLPNRESIEIDLTSTPGDDHPPGSCRSPR